jgi:hypothetical protein
MKVIDILNQYGNKQSISVGDKVLTVGEDIDRGIFVTLSEVIEISDQSAVIEKNKKYYISGQDLPCDGTERCQIDRLKKPIAVRLKEHNEFIDWLAHNISN